MSPAHMKGYKRHFQSNVFLSLLEGQRRYLGAQRNLGVTGTVCLTVVLPYGSQLLLFFSCHPGNQFTRSSTHLLPLLLMTNAVWLLIQKPGGGGSICTARIGVCVLELVREGGTVVETVA